MPRLAIVALTKQLREKEQGVQHFERTGCPSPKIQKLTQNTRAVKNKVSNW